MQGLKQAERVKFGVPAQWQLAQDLLQGGATGCAHYDLPSVLTAEALIKAGRRPQHRHLVAVGGAEVVCKAAAGARGAAFGLVCAS